SRRQGDFQVVDVQDHRHLAFLGRQQCDAEGGEVRFGGNENVAARFLHEIHESSEEIGKAPLLDGDDRYVARKRGPGAGARRWPDERDVRESGRGLRESVSAHGRVGGEIVGQDGDSHASRRSASALKRGTRWAWAGQSSTRPCAIRASPAATWKPIREVSSTSRRRLW